MAEPSHVPWTTCCEEDCIGVRLAESTTCWAHAPDEDRDKAFERFRSSGSVHAQGVRVTADLLARFLAEAPRDADGAIILAEANFELATFLADVSLTDLTIVEVADFSRATFTHQAAFDASTFRCGTTFADATFERRATFEGACFERTADFSAATFHGPARLGHTQLQGTATFTSTVFRDRAELTATWFRGPANLTGATFHGDARFSGAIFDKKADFRDAVFDSVAEFSRARFTTTASFTATTFNHHAVFTYATGEHMEFQDTHFVGSRQLGPLLVREVSLNDATWDRPARIRLSAAKLSCERTRFLGGAHLQLRQAEVDLNQADLSAPSVLTFRPEPEQDEGEAEWIRSLAERPRLVSLRSADVAGLTVDGISLQTCEFADAHNLDRLRVIRSDFDTAPEGWWWTTRQVIAAERGWRTRFGRNPGRWQGSPQEAGANAGPAGGAGVLATQVAGIYRELRKGSEDQKNEPGAADFYYGEMEMRRQATSRRHHHRQAGRRWVPVAGEHVILTLYWLLAGYGLRAWRAFAALALITATAAVAFASWGLEAGSSTGQLTDGLLVSAQAASALLRAPPDRLTTSGEWLHLVLRFVGPVLLSLAVLSVRARVKR